MNSVGSNGSQPTGMHDEGDGQLLCEWCSQDYDHTCSCCVCWNLDNGFLQSVAAEYSLHSYRYGGFPFLGCFWWFLNHEYGDFLNLIRVISFCCSDLVLFAYCSEGAPLPPTAVNMAATDSCLVRLFPDPPSSHYLIWAMCFTLLSSHGHVNLKMNST
jgi:hypothetical protein